MSDAFDDFRARYRRPAIRMEIGGFRPPEAPTTSWFGRVGFALPGESWPCTKDKPMYALCQINLTELPFRPPHLEDLEFITVFVGPKKLPVDQENGTRWCLRAYPRLSELVPLQAPETKSPIKPFPMRPMAAEDDYPCWEDIASPVPEEIEDALEGTFPNLSGLKLGGWPTLIQSRICWGPAEKDDIVPQYVFQIDSTEKGNWAWGDGGVGYFGRGTADGCKDQWVIEWQCF